MFEVLHIFFLFMLFLATIFHWCLTEICWCHILSLFCTYLLYLDATVFFFCKLQLTF